MSNGSTRWYGGVIFVVLLFVVGWLTLEVFDSQSRIERLEELGYPLARADEFEAGEIYASDELVAQTKCNDENLTCEREYPFGKDYAPVLGYRPRSANYPPIGLEASLYANLSVQRRDGWVRLFPSLFSPVTDGSAASLTINHAMQREGAAALSERRGAAVVLDAKTGKVRAMVSTPSFDPEEISPFTGEQFHDAYTQLENDPSHPLFNRAIGGDLYPPGSTFKILTSALMLEKGLTTPDSEVEAPIFAEIEGHEIPNIGYSACGDGFPTFSEAFARSCNTPFVLAASSISDEDLTDITQRFGFGRAQSIPMSVTPSQVAHAPSLLEHAEALLGQHDMRVSPLQMAMVAQAIAAKGELFEPFVVEKLESVSGEVLSEGTPVSLGQAVEPKIADAITSMMVDSVEAEYGSSNGLSNSQYSVAAKTGTAELGDEQGRTIAWVVGFAPVEDPQFAFAVAVEGDDEDPTPHGGDVAVPIARRLLDVALMRGMTYRQR